MAGASEWISNLLRLYDPSDLSGRDQAHIAAEINRYVKDATEHPSLTPLTALLREDLNTTYDHWKHQRGRANYRRFLSTDKWADKRVKVLKRAHYTCEGCGRENVALEVHHLNYDRPWGDEWLFDLVAVCADCHEALTELQREKDV
jgi:5-methylcytosine-specific restriction endonuclease McrA